MMAMRFSRMIIFAAIAGLALVGSAFAQHAFNGVYDSEARYKYLPLPVLPAPQMIKTLSFGLGSVAADLFWLQDIQLIATAKGKDVRLLQNLQAISALDPKFEYPILLGILIYPRYGYISEMTQLAERSMAALPDNWQIPFYLGAQYHATAKDTAAALRYVAIAAEKPNAPPIVKTTYAAYRAGVGDVEGAKILLAAIYETTDNQKTKETVGAALRRIVILEAIQSSVEKYRADVGRYPASMDDLMKKGYVPDTEEIRLMKIVISPDGKIRPETTRPTF